MPCGAVAAVLRYNLFARLVTELQTNLIGIPLIFFFDDFGDMLPADLAEAGLNTLTLY